MANLAIKGHATRGYEVIEILEMLGGKREGVFLGNVIDVGYYIDSKGYIDCGYANFLDNIIYTLDEFLEKFPYKVGDKVVYENKRREITKMGWEERTNTVAYKLDDKLYCNVIDELQPYKEGMDGKYNVEEYLIVWKETEKGLEVVVRDNFELKEDNGKFYIVKKQPQYPKTYEECCEVLGIDVSRTIEHEECPFYKDVTCYENNLLSSLADLRKLLICRDAYWKIAGEQMGLGKPWEPDNNNPDIDLYVIINIYNRAEKATYGYGFQQCVFAFPTKEMRDAFLENFKELIEGCMCLLT